MPIVQIKQLTTHSTTISSQSTKHITIQWMISYRKNHLTFDLTISHNQSTNSRTQSTYWSIQQTYLIFNKWTAHSISQLANWPIFVQMI